MSIIWPNRACDLGRSTVILDHGDRARRRRRARHAATRVHARAHARAHGYGHLVDRCARSARRLRGARNPAKHVVVRSQTETEDRLIMAESFAQWLDEHSTALAGTCPNTESEPDLDTDSDPDSGADSSSDSHADLAGLAYAVRDARVVAVGESSHFIREFGLLRERVLRFLVERLGFTMLAYEYGFSEGVGVDGWVRGEGKENELEAYAASALPVGLAEPLHWLRARNLRGRDAGYVVDPDTPSSAAVRFAGIDLPATGGSLQQALKPVAAFLRQVDPAAVDREALQWLDEALRASTASDALTASLARLRQRFRSLEPFYAEKAGQRQFDLAMHRIDGACATDYPFRGSADASVREKYMAESVLWHLAQSPGTRIVLAAHNAHIQKAPISAEAVDLPMGRHLERALGNGYYALALTSVAGDTARMEPDASARLGFTVTPTPLEAPVSGSIEKAFADVQCEMAEYERPPLMADLRAVDRAEYDEGPQRIRIQESYLDVPVLDAFDGIICIPESSVVVEPHSW